MVSRGLTGRALRMVFGAALSLSAAAAAGTDEVDKEHQIKAAFLYNFSKYVEWPARKAAADSPIVIGAYCPDAFGALLEQIVKGRTVNGRSIAVKTLKNAVDAGTAHLVYVCGENAGLWPRVGEAVRDRFVVTVAESNETAPPDAVIVFIREGDKVRFRIDMAAGGRAGLKVSDQLQKLAVSVRRAP
jgi:hypothetical protein